jgi:SHS2 domain-containing protein
MASQGFEIVDHTADIGIRVWGKDLKTLFLSAAKGMCSLLFEMDTVNSKRKMSLHVEAENPEELLLKWLREILYTMELNRMVFSKFQIEKDNISYRKDDNCFIYGFLWGEKLDKTRHGLCREIKAVTRHGFYLKKSRPGWEAFILFDM